jgi:hypothetical protein
MAPQRFTDLAVRLQEGADSCRDPHVKRVRRGYGALPEQLPRDFQLVLEHDDVSLLFLPVLGNLAAVAASLAAVFARAMLADRAVAPDAALAAAVALAERLVTAAADRLS